jgi:hypothetical protein
VTQAKAVSTVNDRDWRRGNDGEANVATELLEPFVDAVTAAEFLALTPRRLLELARAGDVPAYPLGRGARRMWRFRLSELVLAMEAIRAGTLVAPNPDTSYAKRPPRCTVSG